MNLAEHFAEIRQRLIKSAVVLTITTAISFVFVGRVFDFLIRPAGDIHLIYIEMTEMIGVYMQTALVCGLILAMPFLVYQIMMFVSPALTHQEKKYVYIALPFITLMFAGGVVFGYFVLLPPAMKFLITFGSDIATPQIRIGNYIALITRMLLVTGIVFETPVVITFLSRLGVVTPMWLSSKRGWAFVGAFIFSAILTPTIDPINQSLVAIPLIILYEMSIWLSKLVYRRNTNLVPVSIGNA